MSDNLHEKHRQRMREGYLKKGSEGLETHELLEMLLYNSIPRANTNNSAHQILNLCKKSGFDLLDADLGTICLADGIGEKSAVLIKNSIDLTLRLLTDRLCREPLTDDFAVKLYLYLTFAARREKYTELVLLNRRGFVTESLVLAKGTLHRIDHVIGEVDRLIREKDASSFIVCHNHKNGDLNPSIEDYSLTMGMKEVAKREKVSFLGHYIVTDHRCIKIDIEQKLPCNERDF